MIPKEKKLILLGLYMYICDVLKSSLRFHCQRFSNNSNPEFTDEEDDFLLADADDEKTIEFIKNYLPQELKEKFSDDELYYFLDLIDEYYSESEILDAQPDEDGYVDIDLEEVVAYIVKEAKKDEMGEYDPEEVLFVVQGEMEYGDSLGQAD